jgi:RNA polymerase sigma factor (sigma-70 family)
MLSNKSDEELMLAYQLGDENSFQELYARHSGRIFGFIKSKVKDDVKARDIFQSTFLKLHKTRTRYNTSLPFVPWLFTICRSEFLDALKKDRRSLEDATLKLPENSSSENISEVDLSPLSEPQRKVIEMRFKDDSSFDEIARALETSPANARKMVSRAIGSLRNIYGKK